MTTSIPVAIEVYSNEDVSTRVGIVTLQISQQLYEPGINNQLVQQALPTSYIEGSRRQIQRYSNDYAEKIIDKCITLTAFNNSIICSIGYIYTFTAIFYVGLYIHIMLTYGIHPKIDRQNRLIEINRKYCQNKCDTILILIFYVCKTIWCTIIISSDKYHQLFILLSLLTFFHDLIILYFIQERMLSYEL
tara:strand:+ start:976 stop:1545 length:570 start_codon:yes stop_codon:yes gene_type:complete